jgi:hypothetical protein
MQAWIGTTRDMNSVITGIFPLYNADYTLGEKIDLWRQSHIRDHLLWDEMITTDLSEQVTEFHLPVYYFPADTITPVTTIGKTI